MTLDEMRENIDAIDTDMVRLYTQRMEIAREIGRYKREKHLPVLDPERERTLLNRVEEEAGEAYGTGIRALYSLLLEQSRAEQLAVLQQAE